MDPLALSLEARRMRAQAIHSLIVALKRKLFARHATRSNLRHPRKAGGAPA